MQWSFQVDQMIHQLEREDVLRRARRRALLNRSRSPAANPLARLWQMMRRPRREATATKPAPQHPPRHHRPPAMNPAGELSPTASRLRRARAQAHEPHHRAAARHRAAHRR